MASTLIETININADDFTDNFLTCPTCIGPYDDSEHAPKLLPCSHTLCRNCLERIASSATPVNTLNLTNQQQINPLNSISRNRAAADAAHAALNGSSSTINNNEQGYGSSGTFNTSLSTINNVSNVNLNNSTGENFIINNLYIY